MDATGKAFSLRLAVETGDPWIDQLAIDVTAQLRSAGIDVVIVPVVGPAGLASAAASGTYDLALVSRTSSPFQSVTQGWYSTGTSRSGSNDQQNWSQ